eukprot:2100586-Amphidinium_carterae.1
MVKYSCPMTSTFPSYNFRFLRIKASKRSLKNCWDQKHTTIQNSDKGSQNAQLQKQGYPPVCYDMHHREWNCYRLGKSWAISSP